MDKGGGSEYAKQLENDKKRAYMYTVNMLILPE